MAITVPTVFTGIKARTDAEGTDRWLPDLDYIPALNNAIPALMGYIATAYAERKISEESIRELLFIRIWQTNVYGRVTILDGSFISGQPTNIWGIGAVFAEPRTIPATATITPLPPASSSLRGDLSFDYSDFPCKRMTIEEIAKARKNSFAAGSELMASNPYLRTYSYAIVGNNYSAGYTPAGWEIEIAPKSLTNNVFVAIAVLKSPNVIVNTGTMIELPASLTDLLVKQTCKELAVKAGDASAASLYNVSAQEVIERLSSAL